MSISPISLGIQLSFIIIIATINITINIIIGIYLQSSFFLQDTFLDPGDRYIEV